jgi:hypothetical protein
MQPFFGVRLRILILRSIRNQLYPALDGIYLLSIYKFTKVIWNENR